MGLSRAKPESVAGCHALLFHSFVEEANRSLKAEGAVKALEWCCAASWSASRKGWFGVLGSQELEAVLLSLARTISCRKVSNQPSKRKRWLHVFNEAYGTLGHTNLCKRWMQMDSEVVHDVIITDQRSGDPQNLVAAAEQSGGCATILDPSIPILERAAQLRERALDKAEVVVLHTHPEDVISTIAFGVPGGPPVLFVNHADHQFWVGCAIADLVLDIRRSGHEWTRHCRGVDRAVVLPLPLNDTTSEDSSEQGEFNRKRELRRQLGLPENGVLLLTIGSAAKYNPIGGLDFLENARQILDQCPSVCLIAVGPGNDGGWKELNRTTGGRVLALGRKPDSMQYCRAADLYLEGFPAGSLTALLEAGESGLACVRAPACCAPPFSSDSPGLDVIPQPESLVDYVQTVVDLAQNSKVRVELGRKLQASIRAWHCGDNWRRQLSEMRRMIPSTHSVYPDLHPVAVDDSRRDWLAEYLHSGDKTINRHTVAAYAFVEAWQRTSGEPQIQASLWKCLGEIESGLPKTGSETFLSLRDRLSLGLLNLQIRRIGMRRRLLAKADLAFRMGKRSVARQFTYDCLCHQLTCLADVNWLKMVVKTHLSPECLTGLKRLLAR